MEILKSQKGKDKLAFNGYIYRKNTASRSFQTWRCERKNCRGTARTLLHYTISCEVIECQEHNHKSDPKQKEVAHAVNVMMKEAESTDVPPQQIIADTVLKLSEETMKRLPKKKALTVRIQRKRQNEAPDRIKTEFEADSVRKRKFPGILRKRKIESSLYHLDIPPHDKVIDLFQNVERFLFYDSKMDDNDDDRRRILIFATDTMLRELSLSSSWVFDGSFPTSSPYLIYHLYTIHAFRNGFLYPCAYVFLSDKTLETYRVLSRVMRERCLNNNNNHTSLLLENLIIDLDPGLETALKEEFGGIPVYGSFFHLLRNLGQKLTTLGLRDAYLHNNQVRRFSKVLCALAFLPPSSTEVIKGYECIQDEILVSESAEQLAPLLAYFEDAFLGRWNEIRGRRRLFDVEMWNVRSRTETGIPSIDCQLEGWYENVQTMFSDPTRSIWSVITEIRREEQLQRSSLKAIHNGEILSNVSKREMDVNHRISILIQRFSDRDISMMDFLIGVSDNISLNV